MIAVFDESSNGISKTTEGQVNLLGLFQSFSLNFALKDLLATSQVDQVELSFDRSALLIGFVEVKCEHNVRAGG